MKTLLTFLFVFVTVIIFSQTSINKDLDILSDNSPVINNPDYVSINYFGKYTDERDGFVYQIIKVGEQIWMYQNLNFVSSDSWCYNKKESNCKNYGRLYTYGAAKEVCPDGWHLPSDDEWQTMIVNLEKERDGKSLTQEEKKNGFNTDLGGWRSKSGNFYNFKEIGYYWTSTIKADNYAWYQFINILSNEFSKNYYNLEMAFSVRCIKD